MGWVGVVTLVATACYVLYRFPPRAWGQDREPPDSIPGPGDKASHQKTEDPERPVSRGNDEQKEEREEDKKEKEEEGEEAETPKASPASGPLEVPELNLDDDTQNERKPDSQDRDSAPRVAQVNNKPTIMPPSPQQPPPPQPTPSPQTSSRNFLMPPPPPPSLRQRTTPAQQTQSQSQSQLLTPGRSPARPMSNPNGSSFLAPPPSAAASQRGPPPSTSSSGSSLAPPRSSNSLAPPLSPANSLKPSKNASKRAILEPGYSPLDWAALTSNPKNTLRGAHLPPTLIRVTPSMLKTQNGRKGRDVWTSYQGKVYNITPYVPFHPGGKGELLRGAGKDSANLFLEVHPWVNWDAILGECLVGILVAEGEQVEGNTLDAMD